MFKSHFHLLESYVKFFFSASWAIGVAFGGGVGSCGGLVARKSFGAASGGSVWRRERIRLCALSARRGPKEVMSLFLSLSSLLSLSLSFSSLAVAAAAEASGGMLRLQFFRLGRKKRSCRARWRHQGLCARPDRHQQRSAGSLAPSPNTRQEKRIFSSSTPIRTQPGLAARDLFLLERMELCCK